MAQKGSMSEMDQAWKEMDWELGEERKQNNGTYSTTGVRATKHGGFSMNTGTVPGHYHGAPMERGHQSELLCSVPVSKESLPAGLNPLWFPPLFGITIQASRKKEEHLEI